MNFDLFNYFDQKKLSLDLEGFPNQSNCHREIPVSLLDLTRVSFDQRLGWISKSEKILTNEEYVSSLTNQLSFEFVSILCDIVYHFYSVNNNDYLTDLNPLCKADKTVKGSISYQYGQQFTRFIGEKLDELSYLFIEDFDIFEETAANCNINIAFKDDGATKFRPDLICYCKNNSKGLKPCFSLLEAKGTQNVRVSTESKTHAIAQLDNVDSIVFTQTDNTYSFEHKCGCYFSVPPADRVTGVIEDPQGQSAEAQLPDSQQLVKIHYSKLNVLSRYLERKTVRLNGYYFSAYSIRLFSDTDGQICFGIKSDIYDSPSISGIVEFNEQIKEAGHSKYISFGNDGTFLQYEPTNQ